MHRITLTVLLCLFLLLNHSLPLAKTKQPETTLQHSSSLSAEKKTTTGATKIPARPDPTGIKADLVIRSFSCSPAAVREGATTTLRAVVTNTGKGKAAGFDVAFYHKNKLVGKKQKLSITAGQSIEVVSIYRPEQSGRLTIEVRADSGNTVAETNEKNNSGDSIVAVSKALPAKQMQPPPPSLTKKPLSSPSATQPAVGPTMGTIRKPTTMADLAVEQIDYHHDSASLPRGILSTSKTGISCVIRNSGAVQLDPQAFRQSRIDITIDRKPLPGYFRLEQLVPYNKIAKPGSQATAWIPVELQKKSAVSITVNSNNAIAETTTANNSGSALLGASGVNRTVTGKTTSPQKHLPEQIQKSATDRQSRKFPTSHNLLAEKNGLTLSTGTLMAKNRPTAALQQDIPGATPKLLDLGIEIISPSFEDVYSPSSLIPIRYRFSRTVAPGGAVVFMAMRGGEVAATVTIRNDNPPGPDNPYRQVDLQLPGTISGGNYLISAEHEVSGAAGLSDMFRVVALEAEEIEGSDEVIGDGGGYGGPGRPTLYFVRDLSNVHINTRDYGTNAAPLEWAYYGPLAAAPDRWQLELLEPSTSAVIETAPLICNDAVDTPASTTQALPSRRCSALFSCRDRNGSYQLRLSGAGLSTESSGVVHCGIDELRTHFSWFNVSPTAVIQGEPIIYGFTYSPPESELTVQLLRDDEPEYTHMVPRQASDDGYATYEGRIETDSLPIGNGNYRFEVRNRYSGVGHSRGPISIMEPPFTETDENGVDFHLTALRVNEEGRLQVNTAITRASSGVRVLSYRLAYMVAREGSTEFRRIERDVPVAGGWIDLGHIHSLTTVDERRSAGLSLRVLVNQPVEIVEQTYANNSISERVWTRGSYATCRLSNAPGETYYGDGVLQYEIDRHWPADTLTQLYLDCFNRSFANTTGRIEVIQDREVPGEMRSETVNLGSTTLTVPATDDFRMEDATSRLALFSDRGGISYPRPGNGELRIILHGSLYFNRDRQERTIDFRLR